MNNTTKAPNSYAQNAHSFYAANGVWNDASAALILDTSKFKINTGDTSGNNNLYISIDEISNQNLSSVDKIKSNVLINIPIDVNHSDILMYSNVNKIKTRVHLLNYKKFTVNILDENFNYVDFHNKDWYCTLLFESSIDNELYRKFIYLRNLLSGL